MGSTTTSSATRGRASGASRLSRSARRKFLGYFPAGFRDQDYVGSERDYKWQAHLQWREALGDATLRNLLRQKRFTEIAERATRIEGRTNLLFSFEKMALRDGVKGRGAPLFAQGLYSFLHGDDALKARFEAWVDTLAQLPRRQTRVLTWPVATVFGFIAQPKTHFFIKPNVMRRAAEAYGAEFAYQSRPNWETYASALALAARVRREQRDLGPRDMIDIQSFLWVQGSDEYPD
ncbi:MAG TPA: hypothetical protein VEF55_10130 [Candidatus Binatia bacterium]|nr:hypothetical protein [Candidatus Binatia bacterium]